MINCVCAIAKNENNYINEWCNHYLKVLKFDRIYLYDNNDSTTPYIGNFIDSDIKDKVTIFDWRDKHYKNMQWAAYQDFYDKYNKTINWVLFCDIDEFLTGINSVKDFLENPKFKEFDQIRIKWRLFGDSDLITRDIHIPVMQSFTKVVNNNSELSNQGKAFVRGGLSNILIKSCHYALYQDKSKLRTCLPSGRKCIKDNTFQIIEDYSQETIFLNHYMTKSLEEFLNCKFKRGDAIKEKRDIDLDYFWQLNKKTPEKLNFIQNKLNSDKIDLVLPYVDNTDKNWIKIFNQYSTTVKKTEQTTAKNRFRSENEFFRYFFRCIEANMSFINKIYLLVMSESQVPYWINRERVNIITHDQFIPAEYLPTFNSGTIEMFLHNIPGLSEKFIYANDDFFCLTKMERSDFFEGERCKFNLKQCSVRPERASSAWQWFSMCQNNSDLIYGTKKAVPFWKLGHEFRPYFKSKYKECFIKYKKEILSSISQFRSEKNLTCYLFSLYLDKINKRTSSSLVNKVISSGYNSNLTVIRERLNSADMLCLNDTREEVNIYSNQEINKWFEQNFSHYSIYEKECKEGLHNSSRSKDIRIEISEKVIVPKAEAFTGLTEEWWKEDF